MSCSVFDQPLFQSKRAKSEDARVGIPGEMLKAESLPPMVNVNVSITIRPDELPGVLTMLNPMKA